MEETKQEDQKLEKKEQGLVRIQSWKVYYFLLAVIVGISVYIRTLNISKLKDVSTGGWTLGPDLDPFLFLRWAKEIAANGSLSLIDSMRYVPLGFNTAEEMRLLSYSIAWLHKVLSVFSLSNDITYTAIIFPVIMFALTSIAFFLFVSRVFHKEKERNLIALISTAFFIVIPSLLPRTIAGIPEKESVAFLFMFLAFYFFMGIFMFKEKKKILINSGLAGLSSALMALYWGGYIFVFLTISVTVLLYFFAGRIEKDKIIPYVVWLFSSFLVMWLFSARYHFTELFTSIATGSSVVVLFIILIHYYFVKKFNLGKYAKLNKLPKEFLSFLVAILIIIILASVLFGPSFITSKINSAISTSVSPLGTTRFALTVAENQQPFFVNDWKESFGPVFSNIPLFFWLLFAGSVVLFYEMMSSVGKKYRNILTLSYLIFLTGLIFSKYSSASVLNGETALSKMVYFGGMLFFGLSLFYVYYKKHQSNETESLKNINIGYLIYFVVLTLSIIAARGGVRLIMVLAAVAPVSVAFLIYKTGKVYFSKKEDTSKLVWGILFLVILIASMFTWWIYFNSDRVAGESYAPGAYQWQWQNAMSWVRENTPENAVFAHWWDYGYWVQSIGERATILDGGNVIVYWDHLLGRHVLTGSDEKTALEFLYTHNATHLLIDSTDIGKYPAFSSIGSDENYDRYSWIQTFLLDDRQTQETNQDNIYVYSGGSRNDKDITWNLNGTEVFIPEKSSIVAGFIIRENKQTGQISQPNAVYVYNDKQYSIPLRYAYYDDKLKDYGNGLNAGIFFYPSVNTASGQLVIKEKGAVLYLSEKTINSNLARLYLFDEKNSAFELVHTEDNLVVEELKRMGNTDKDFVYYNGLQGPIKIWEINYPANIQSNEEFLLIDYPSPELEAPKPGYY